MLHERAPIEKSELHGDRKNNFSTDLLVIMVDLAAKLVLELILLSSMKRFLFQSFSLHALSPLIFIHLPTSANFYEAAFVTTKMVTKQIRALRTSTSLYIFIRNSSSDIHLKMKFYFRLEIT